MSDSPPTEQVPKTGVLDVKCKDSAVVRRQVTCSLGDTMVASLRQTGEKAFRIVYRRLADRTWLEVNDDQVFDNRLSAGLHCARLYQDEARAVAKRDQQRMF